MPPVQLGHSFCGNTGRCEPLGNAERDEKVDGGGMVFPEVHDGVVVEVVVYWSATYPSDNDVSAHSDHVRYTRRV